MTSSTKSGDLKKATLRNRPGRRMLCAAVAVCSIVASGAWGQVRALTGATIIDGNGGSPVRDGVVLIEGKIIRAVGPRGKVVIPANAEIIDARGKFVLPGLMDANVHLVPWPSWEYIEFLARYEDRFPEIIAEAAQIALKHGFTTVFDSMGPLKPLMLVRDRINNGEVVGARVFAAGDIVGFRAVFTTAESEKSASKAFQKRINDLFEAGGGPDLSWKTPRQVHDQMARYVAQGPDFVKFGATGDGMPVNSEVGQEAVLRFTPEQMRAMVAAVHEAGKIIQTHQTYAPGLEAVVEAGVDMAQHCAHTGLSRIEDRTIKLMLDRHFYCGTQWGPLSAEEQGWVRSGNFPGGGTDVGNGEINYSVENAVRLIKAGIPELVSTDAGTIDPDVRKDFGADGPPGGLGGKDSLIGDAEFIDMQAMAQRGMTPMMIIQAATRNIAAAYHKLDSLGTLEAGKAADMIVVDADPLQDVQNLRRVSAVIKDGRSVDTAALPLHPVLTSPEAESPGSVRAR